MTLIRQDSAGLCQYSAEIRQDRVEIRNVSAEIRQDCAEIRQDSAEIIAKLSSKLCHYLSESYWSPQFVFCKKLLEKDENKRKITRAANLNF